MKQSYLLLDAGGTLMFPNFRVMSDLARASGEDVGEECFRRAFGEFTAGMEDRLFTGLQRSDWPQFVPWVLEKAGIPSTKVPKLAEALYDLDSGPGLWAYTYPWVHDALQKLLSQGYRLSVISNADGRVERDLTSVGLRPWLERVYDSSVVGFEKPDPRLFHFALSELGLLPEQCLYVGDVYHIDVLGANRAGIGAIHLDPFGLYGSYAGHHIPSVSALPDFLQRSDLASEAFFPLRRA